MEARHKTKGRADWKATLTTSRIILSPSPSSLFPTSGKLTPRGRTCRTRPKPVQKFDARNLFDGSISSTSSIRDPPLLETRREEKKDPNVVEKGDEKKETLIRFVYST